MPLQRFYGFEHGAITGEGNATSGSVAIASDQAHTGTYSARINGAATTGRIQPGGSTNYRVSFWLRIHTWTPPSGGVNIAWRSGYSSLFINENRYLVGYVSGGGTNVVGAHQLPLDTWVRISVSGSQSAPYVTKAYINGVEEVSWNHNNGGVAFNCYAIGPNASGTYDIYVDDIATDNTDSTADLGDVRVIASYPASAGDSTQYTPNPGAPNWDCVNDLSETDEVHAAGTATDLYGIQSTSTLGISGCTPLGVNLLERVYITGTPTGVYWTVKDNGTGYDGSSLGGGLTGSYRWLNRLMTTMPNGGGAWTEARVNAFQVGNKVTGSGSSYVACVLAMLAYIPVANAYEDAASRFSLVARGYEDVAARLKLVGQAFKDAAARFRVVGRAYGDVGARFVLTLASATYRFVPLRFAATVRAFKDAAARVRLTAQAFKDTAARFGLTVRVYKDVAGRYLLRAPAVKDIAARYRLIVRAFKDAAGRFRLTATAFEDVQARFRLTVQMYKDVADRFRTIVRTYKDAAARFALRATAYKDIAERYALVVRVYKDAALRVRITGLAFKDIAGRFVLTVAGTAWQDIAGRFRVTSRSFKDVAARFILQSRAYKDVSNRVRLTVRVLKDAPVRFTLNARSFTDVLGRLRVVVGAYADVAMRSRFTARTYTSIDHRFSITLPPTKRWLTLSSTLSEGFSLVASLMSEYDVQPVTGSNLALTTGVQTRYEMNSQTNTGLTLRSSFEVK